MSTTIRQRLILLTAVPLVAIAVSAGALLKNSYQSYRSAEDTRTVLQVAVAAGNLIHGLQVERGSTAGFLQSKGEKFADALPGVRARTDDALRELDGKSSGLAMAAVPELNRALTAARGKLETLATIRQRADRFEVSVQEEVAGYTAGISALIDAVATTGTYNSDPAIARQAVSYVAFIRAKETAGLERALTTTAFATNQVEPAHFLQILDKVHRQEAYLDIFRGSAGAAEKASLQNLLEGAATKEVQRLRDILVEKAGSRGFDVEPTTWFKTMTEKIDAMYATELLVARNIDAAAGEIHADSRRVFYGHLALVVLAVGLMIGVSAWVAASVTRPLQVEVDVAELAVRDNDFSHDVPESGPVEVVRAGHAFNELMAKFREIISAAKQSSEQITGAAHTLAAASQRVQDGSAAQSDSASGVAAAVEQASVSVSETASNASAAAGMVARARRETETTLALMADAIAMMKQIAELIGESGIQVTRLSESSSKIGGIVEVIRDIADQTNLLALNAAIEAARAGEQGRGFAVVADEVRKLAERTTQATGEIGGLIKSIQSGIGGTVGAMQQADAQAARSLELVAQTEGALTRIDNGSREVAETVTSISDALAEQDAAIRQVALNIEKIAQMTETNSQAAASNNATAKELDALSAELRSSVARFKI